MDFIKPAGRGRRIPAGIFLLAVASGACARRPPVLIPPSSGVEAVEGSGSASIEGAGAAIKGKFAFLFRRPGFGRVEAFDPIGRTVFLVLFGGGRGWFVLPGKQAFAEDEAGIMMARFLGIALLPEETLRLVSGTWEGDGAEDGWRVDRDELGRVAAGVKNDFRFEVREFFPGGGVPRQIGLSGPGTSGRLKVIKLGFNPPPRDEAFDVSFLRTYAVKTWDDILGLLDR
jgi:hypothetical protein